MVNIFSCSRLIPVLLLLPFTVIADHHEEAVDEQVLEEAQFIEELLSDEVDALGLDVTEPDNDELDILVEDTPLISPADDNVTNAGVIDRYPSDPSDAQSDNIARSAFSLSIIDREPVDEVSAVSEDSVYYFTELSGLEGELIRHRWVYDNQVMADVEFMVGGPRWRVWSKKTLLPRWAGQWTVNVVDDGGAVLQTETINYIP